MVPPDAYTDEPWHDRCLANYVVRGKEPFNAESCTGALVDSFVTPTERHFRRNHGPIPHIASDEWTMTVEVDVCAGSDVRRSTRTVTRGDLARLPQFEVVAVLECAGNR
ncbi:hypothetical protein H4R19_004572, partial [Coemansia spiralis]